MKTEQEQELFRQLLEGALSEEEQVKLQGQLGSDADMQSRFESFASYFEAEQSLASENFELSPYFEKKVMREIEQSSQLLGVFRRLEMMLAGSRRLTVGAVGSTAVLLIAVVLVKQQDRASYSVSGVQQRFEKAMEPAAPYESGPVLAEGTLHDEAADSAEVSNAPATETLKQKVVKETVKPVDQVTAAVPSGYRAITIEVDQATAVEGFARPGAKVDLAWTNEIGGNSQTSVITQDSKVLSVDGSSAGPASGGQGKSTVTLLVKERDAQKIQLAKKSGRLSALTQAKSDSSARRSPVISLEELYGGSPSSARRKQIKGAVRIGGKDYEISADGALSKREAEKPRGVQEGFGQALGEAQSTTRLRAAVRQPSAASFVEEELTSPVRSLKKVKPAPGVPVDKFGSLHRYDIQPRQENRERYGQWEENERIPVAQQPVSTFSIDVDTGSYTNTRRFLQMGQLPPKNAVRIEEFINYFSYNYPKQFEKPFSLNYEIAPDKFAKGRHLLKLGIKARDARDEEKPWNLVFLVDVSGSMTATNKLPLVKNALKILVQKMRPRDTIALVTYAGRSGVALEPTGVDGRDQILAVIDSLQSGGSTHGSSGIRMAYNLALRNKIAGGINRVILATDGDFNVGVTSNDQLFKMIEEKRKSGITLTTVGVGAGNYNEAMMEQVANKGNGNYFYLDSLKEARKVFETDLLGTLEVVAKDVKLQMEFNPEHVLEYRLVGYENRKLRNEDFNNDKIDAGEIGAGHTVTALYEIVLKNSPIADELTGQLRYQQPKRMEVSENAKLASELGFLKVRFKQPEGSTSTRIDFPIQLEHIKEKFEEASADFRFVAAVSAFAHLLRESRFAATDDASEIAEVAAAATGEDAKGYRAELVELIRNAALGMKR